MVLHAHVHVLQALCLSTPGDLRAALLHYAYANPTLPAPTLLLKSDLQKSSLSSILSSHRQLCRLPY